MKIKNKITALVLGLGMVATGCSDYLDVNTDPNNLLELPTPESIMPSAQVGLGNQLMGWDLGFSGGVWNQYWTQNYSASQFKALCEYDEFSFSTAYNDFYSYILNDLKAMRDLSEEGSGNYLVGEVLSIYTWQMVTDIWGDMPYFEALQGDAGITSPKTDSGEEIYADLLKRIDALLATDHSNAILVEKYDFVYGGEVDYWLEFAESLKLKLMIRLSETSQYDNAATLAYVESASLLSHSALISGNIWANEEGKRHPMVEYEASEADYLKTNIIANKTFIDYLITNNDPRLDLLFVAGDDGQKGAFNGDFDSKEDSDMNGTADDKEDYSTVVFDEKSDIPLMSTWEVNFYVAEVYARANNAEKAKEYFDIAVNASLGYWGIDIEDNKDGTVNDNNIVADSHYAAFVAGTVEEMIKQIAMQKWIANCKLQHIESFLERNRTKYPSVNDIDIASDRTNAFINFPVGDFTVSVVGRGKLNGEVPRSPIYPNTLINRNVNSPSQKGSIKEPIWWDQKVGK